MNNVRLQQQECRKELKRKYFPSPFPPNPPSAAGEENRCHQNLYKNSLILSTCLLGKCRAGTIPDLPAPIRALLCARVLGAVGEHLVKRSEMAAAFSGLIRKGRAEWSQLCGCRGLPVGEEGSR